MPKAAGICLAALAAACASGPPRPVLTGPHHNVLVGRVVEREEVAHFIGDLATRWWSLVIEATDAPHLRLRVHADGDACPAIGDRDGVYRLTLRRRWEPIALQQNQGRDLIGDFVISECASVES